MKFKKLVKADENFDEIIEDLKFKSVQNFYDALEKIANRYKMLGMKKEDILSSIEEASTRLEESIDEI